MHCPLGKLMLPEIAPFGHCSSSTTREILSRIRRGNLADMRAHDDDHRYERGSRPRASRLEPVALSAQRSRPAALAGPVALAALQHAAGNAAVSGMIGTFRAPDRAGSDQSPARALVGQAWVQRCGTGSSCDCPEEEKEAALEREAAGGQVIARVQRDADQAHDASACADTLDGSGGGPAGPGQSFQAEIAGIEITSDISKAFDSLQRIWMAYGPYKAGLYVYEVLKQIWVVNSPRSADQFVDRLVGRVNDDRASIKFAHYQWIVATIVGAQQKVRTESRRFIACYEEQARELANGALDASQERVTNELKHYFGSWGIVQDVFGSNSSQGEGQDKAAQRGLGIAAEGLAKRRSTLIKANLAYRGSVGNRSLDLAGREPIENAQATAEDNYAIFRNQVVVRYPVLEAVSSPTIDAWDEDAEIDDEEGQQLSQLAQLARGDTKDATTVILKQVFDRLRDIARIRKELQPGGEVNIWRVPRIVEATNGLTAAKPGTFYGRIVDDQVNKRPSDSWTTRLMDIVEIGLYLLAPLTEGLSLIPATMITAHRVGSRVIEHWRQYQTQKALRGTDFGPAALSSEDPSLLWLAVDVTAAFVEIGLTVVPAAEAFRALTPLARAARAATAGAETLVALESAAEELTARKLGADKAEKFAERVVADARAARSGEVSGMTVEEARLLNEAEAQAGGAVGKRTGVELAVGANLPSEADHVVGAAVEQKLAKAGATPMLEEARSAVRAGKTDEAELLFSQLEEHLTAEQASLLWRDLGAAADSATRLTKPITLLNESHLLKLVQGEDGAFFVLCSWCTRVRDVLAKSMKEAVRGGDAARVGRLEELIRQVETMEASITKVAKGEATSVATMRSLMGKLTEGEHLIGSVLEARPRGSAPNFTALAKDPGVAGRAAELYQGYVDQLWQTRREIFAGKKVKDQVWKEVEKEAEARALMQARRESVRGAPAELPPGAPARTSVDPRADIPYGFYDRPGFDQFSKRLNAALPSEHKAELVMEGSAVTGRRFERIAAPVGPTGTPFNLGRLSDFDVAIVSDSLYAQAKVARPSIPMSGDLAAMQTQQLKPEHLKQLGLVDLDRAAHEAILDATGIAHPVHFVIRPSKAPAKLSLPLTGAQ